jgi:transcription elongation factor GreA
MSEQPTFLTKEGQKKLEEELHYLQTVRRRGGRAFARGDGRRRHRRKRRVRRRQNEQAFVEGRILTLENMLKNAVIIDEKAHHDEVTLGAVVSIVEGGNSPEEYHVVGAAEADPPMVRSATKARWAKRCWAGA